MTIRLTDGVVVLWRDDGCVQLEFGQCRIVVDNVSDSDVLAILPQRYSASRAGGRPPTAPHPDLLAALADAGLVTTDAAPIQDIDAEPVLPGHVQNELMGLARRGIRSAPDVISRRAHACVALRGSSRLAVMIGATLAAAGVGEILLDGPGDVAAADAGLGGLLPEDEGRPFLPAARDAIHRAAPQAMVRAVRLHTRPTLLVLTDAAPVDPSVAAGLVSDGVVHLRAALRPGEAVIGPLVIPGLSSCLTCADRTRADLDPAWPVLALQLNERTPRRLPVDGALAAAAAGIAAGQVLAWLDGENPSTIDGSLEWHLPDWRLRRRTWRPHPRCDCGAASPTTPVDRDRCAGTAAIPTAE